jgi:hypothetical protein
MWRIAFCNCLHARDTLFDSNATFRLHIPSKIAPDRIDAAENSIQFLRAYRRRAIARARCAMQKSSLSLLGEQKMSDAAAEVEPPLKTDDKAPPHVHDARASEAHAQFPFHDL